MHSLSPTRNSRHTAGLRSYTRHSMVSRSRAAHQPSSRRAMIRPPHRSTSVNSSGTSSSPMSITSSLQQQALQEAQVMAGPSLSSVTLDSVAISLTMEGQPFARIMLVGAQRNGGVLNPSGRARQSWRYRLRGQPILQSYSSHAAPPETGYAQDHAADFAGECTAPNQGLPFCSGPADWSSPVKGPGLAARAKIDRMPNSKSASPTPSMTAARGRVKKMV